MIKNKEKRSLLKNTVMLYILTFSTYLMSFIVVPYETRILGVEKYGLIGLSLSIMAYFQLVIDFGFLLSGTEEVSRNREDKKSVSKIFTAVTLNKLILSALSFFVLFSLCFIITRWEEYRTFLIISFFSTMVGSLIPDYLYRGLEKMETITIRTVLIKLFFTIMVFIVVKSPEDYLLIPVLQLIGNTVALIGVYIHLFFKLKIGFIPCNIKEIFSFLKGSSVFFASRIATTVYTATNTIILDFISAGAMTAFYTSADKLVSTAKSGISPIADSLYPYMIRNKDFKLVRKLLLILEPMIIMGCIIVFIFAEPLCIWFFGTEYGQTGIVLRTLLPVVIIILPTYIFGFPVLGAMGLNKHANYSTMIGSIVHIIQLVLLAVCGKLSLITLGIATSLTETIILAYRIIIVLKNKALFTKGD